MLVLVSLATGPHDTIEMRLAGVHVDESTAAHIRFQQLMLDQNVYAKLILREPSGTVSARLFMTQVWVRRISVCLLACLLAYLLTCTHMYSSFVSHIHVITVPLSRCRQGTDIRGI